MVYYCPYYMYLFYKNVHFPIQCSHFLSQCNEYFLVTRNDYKSEHTSVPFMVSLSTVAVKVCPGVGRHSMFELLCLVTQ